MKTLTQKRCPSEQSLQYSLRDMPEQLQGPFSSQSWNIIKNQWRDAPVNSTLAYSEAYASATMKPLKFVHLTNFKAVQQWTLD